MVGLRSRVGAEGFFCIVRSNPDFNVKPQWYFTTPEVESYMKIACRPRWDTYTVGTKIEAFAIAGCDVLSTSLYISLLNTLNYLRSPANQQAEG
jgi:hypothetical protein